MRNTRLEMKFKTKMGKNYKVSVNDANELLEKDEVVETMNQIIEEDVFHYEESSLEHLDSARYVTTSVKEIF